MTTTACSLDFAFSPDASTEECGDSRDILNKTNRYNVPFDSQGFLNGQMTCARNARGRLPEWPPKKAMLPVMDTTSSTFPRSFVPKSDDVNFEYDFVAPYYDDKLNSSPVTSDARKADMPEEFDVLPEDNPVGDGKVEEKALSYHRTEEEEEEEEEEAVTCTKKKRFAYRKGNMLILVFLLLLSILVLALIVKFFMYVFQK